MSTMTRLALAIVLIAAVGGMGFLVIRARRAPPANAAHPALTVTIHAADRTTWPRELPANGSLIPWQEAVIAAETGGLRISELLVDVGAVVKRGQVLARLADDSVISDVAVATALQDQSQATATETRANADRARQGRTDGTLSAQVIAQYLAAETRAEAELAAARARLANQQLRLSQTQIRAIDDGIILTRQAILGSVVQSGNELFRLIRQGRIVWRAEVDASHASDIRIGQTARISLPDGKTCSGTVELIEPGADAGTRLQHVRIALPTESTARTGWFAHGVIQLGEDEALHVPESALVLRDGRSFVFVCRDGVVEQRQVVTGRRQDGLVELASGLRDDELVVDTGGAFLNDGDHVLVQQ
jgi:HlyD family secretion protein